MRVKKKKLDFSLRGEFPPLCNVELSNNEGLMVHLYARNDRAVFLHNSLYVNGIFCFKRLHVRPCRRSNSMPFSLEFLQTSALVPVMGETKYFHFIIYSPRLRIVLSIGAMLAVLTAKLERYDVARDIAGVWKGNCEPKRN